MIGMLSFFSYRWDVYIYMGHERGIYGIYDIYIYMYIYTYIWDWH
jgi:hypothetical protein